MHVTDVPNMVVNAVSKLDMDHTYRKDMDVLQNLGESLQSWLTFMHGYGTQSVINRSY